MTISLKSIAKNEISVIFSHFKHYLYDTVDTAIGWDDEVQSKGFYDNYRAEWIYWIEYQGDVVGILCMRQKKASWHIHLLIVFEAYQGKGASRVVMSFLKDKATSDSLALTLSSFKCNDRAVAFYRRIGFVTVSEDKLFYDFRWRLGEQSC